MALAILVAWTPLTPSGDAIGAETIQPLVVASHGEVSTEAVATAATLCTAVTAETLLPGR